MISPIDPKDYIGYNAADVVNYLNKTTMGKATRRFFLLHGPPGCGKTTLIDVIEHSEHVTMRRSNASDARKTGDIKIGDYLSSGIKNENVCVVLDECDGLPKTTWKKIEEISNINNKIPIILIANNISKIPDKIRKQCMEKEIKVNHFSMLAFAKRVNDKENLGLTSTQINEFVDRCRSYRCLIHLLEYGYSDEMEIPVSQNEHILNALHGKFTEFKPTDLRNIIVIINDNVKSPMLISDADVWLSRYEHGYKYGKNICGACLNAIRAKKVKLDYPRTYALIHTARNKGKSGTKSKGTKRKMPNIAVIGVKK